jgi:ribosomal protein S18 acetylase RimI-like enzyme
VTDDELAARRRATQRSFYSMLPGRWFGPVFASLVPSSPGRSLFNAVTYEDAAAVPPLLPSLSSLYADAGVRAWTVWVLPGDEPLASALAAAGHALDATPEAMGAALASLSLDGPDVAGDCTWADVVASNAAAYGVAADELQAMRLAGDGVRLYGADGGSVVLAIHDHDGDAHVTLVGTLEAARGRGLATLLMCQALADARERDCTTTTLVATKMGHPLYARLGYRDFGRVQMWERRRPA